MSLVLSDAAVSGRVFIRPGVRRTSSLLREHLREHPSLLRGHLHSSIAHSSVKKVDIRMQLMANGKVKRVWVSSPRPFFL